MATGDLPVQLGEALRALDGLPPDLRGVPALRQFLESLHEMQTPPPTCPDYLPFPDRVRLEYAYSLGARCLTLDGRLLVLERATLFELLRTATESQL